MILTAIFSLFVSIIYILYQSLHPAYYLHLYPDVFAFFDRAGFFWDNFTLKDLGYNEYQPGAITFFISLTPVLLIDYSLETFKWALFAANCIFLLLYSFLLFKMKKTEGIFLISLILVFLGPILLFRFDLLVILLTTLSFYFWEKNKNVLSVIILALGVITKVYPVIFLPYLLYQNFRKNGFSSSGYLFLVFTTTLLFCLFAYTAIFNISLSDTLVSFNFHSLKSVATESVWASFIYFYHAVAGLPLPGMESAYGINAIARNEVYPPILFYNYFWIIPLGFVYLLFFLKNKQSFSSNNSWEKLNYVFLSFLLLTFLIFSKVLSNQYLAWFLFMIPLIDAKILISKKWIINIFLILLTVIMHTYIFPLNYSAWLDTLTKHTQNQFLLWTVLVSNFILVILFVRIGNDVYKNHK